MVVRNVLSPVEVKTMRHHADAIAADLDDGYRARDQAEHVLELVPDFELDATTSRMFGGRGRPGSYDLPYKRADRNLIAVEL